jgi:4-amino-4-deoxy-L-arabinose transferase-like glycosyltransferase
MADHRGFWVFLAAVTLLRFAVIGHFGLGVDEAHYVLYGLHPALSYFDHPPLVGWTEWFFTSLFGIDAFAARIPAVLIGAAASILVYFWLLRLFSSKTLALWGIFALNASFLFNALFMMLMPDTLLFVFIIPIMATALRIEAENRTQDWLLLGLLLGLSGLSKYTAVLFVAALLLYFLLRRRWDLFVTPKMLPGILLAAAIVAPVILWNMQNGWISFAFQSAHVTGADHINFNAFVQSTAAQFGAYSPFLFPVAFYGLYRALKARQEPPLFLTGIFGLVIMVFFTYNSFHARALPHWTSLFYLLFIPIGTVMLLQKSRFWRRYAYSAVGISAVVTLVLYAELRLPFIPFPDYKSVHRDLYGWPVIMKHVAAQIGDPANQAAAVTNWSLASRALFYGRPYPFETFLIDRKYDQFDLWQHGKPEGKDLLFITTHDFRTDINASMRCARTENADTFDLTLGGHKVNTVRLVWCRDFRGMR